MNSTLNIFFKKLLGLDTGARLTRLPFILAHVLGYAVLFFLLQLSEYLYVGTAGIGSMGQFSFAIILFVITLILFPIHVRRSHDLGWSIRYPFYFSILPALLRIACLMIPLFALFNENLIGKLFVIMPYIGLLFWFLNQIQLVFMVLLFFAPSTGSHNRFAQEPGRTFVFENLYGFRLFKKLAKPAVDK